VWKPDGTLHRKLAHKANVTGLAFSPDGALLVAHSGRGHPVVWDVESGKEVATAPVDGVASVRFSSDGQRIAVAAADCRVCILRIA
jgi:WD40 repeat protein